MASRKLEIEFLSLDIIQGADDLFHGHVKTEEYDQAHRYRMERDQEIQDFHEKYGRLPEKDRTHGFWK